MVFQLFDELPVILADGRSRPASLIGVVGKMPIEGLCWPTRRLGKSDGLAVQGADRFGGIDAGRLQDGGR